MKLSLSRRIHVKIKSEASFQVTCLPVLAKRCHTPVTLERCMFFNKNIQFPCSSELTLRGLYVGAPCLLRTVSMSLRQGNEF